MERTFKLLLLVFVVGHAAEAGRARQGKQMFQQKTTYTNRETGQRKLCQVDKTKGSCMTAHDCSRQKGLFAGYCGVTDDYCCVVDKTCGGRTSAYQAYFRNPSFPKNDSEARVCNFELEIGRKVCAVRMHFDKFQLARYEDGVCIRDTLTILGTSLSYPVTPICGNMTNWATTFTVNERSRVTFAMVLQGNPAYTFSISVTQLACDDITPFLSPTVAGIRNADAVKYVPTTTTTTPEPTTTDESSTDETTTIDPEETTTPVETTTVPSEEEDPEEETTEAVPKEEPSGPTTLKPGKLPVPTSTEGVLIRMEPEADYEDFEYNLEYLETTPAISAFRRAFELKVNDRCWQYEDESDTGFRIIGGRYTKLNEYPWQVALVYKTKFFCGGSLISDRHVLTASHCIFGSFSKGLGALKISLGDHDLRTRNETKNVVSKVKSIYWHLHYNPHTTVHDIAILELEDPVDFSYNVAAVKLPSDLEDRYEEANATVTGWGRYTIKKKSTSAIVKEYTGPLMNTSLCVRAWKKYPGISASYDRHVCLDVTMGTPCHGDSGGPLVVCSGVQCTQVGVVSFGFPLCTNVGLPAVFTRVTHYMSWLNMNLVPLHYV